MLERGVAALELCAWCVAIYFRGDASHFTWWGIAAHALFLAFVAGGHPESLYLTNLTLQSIVIFGVWFMSASGCDTLVDTAADVGPAAYTLGNFALHYWPTLSSVWHGSAPVTDCTRQSSGAVSVWLLFCAVQQPTAVYGCPFPYEAALLSGVGAGCAVSWLIRSHASARRHGFADF